MTDFAASRPQRRNVLKGAGIIPVALAAPRAVRAKAALTPIEASPIPVDQVDSFLAIAADGRVTAFNGRVDLATGARTAFGQRPPSLCC